MRPETLLLLDDDATRARSLHQRYRSQGWEVLWTSRADELAPLVHARGIEPLVAIAGGMLERPVGLTAEWILIAPPGAPLKIDDVTAPFALVPPSVSPAELDVLVASAARLARRERRDRAAPASPTPADFLGGSASAARVRASLERLRESAAPVALVGERGTGRGLAARIAAAPGGPLIELTVAAQTERALLDLFGCEADDRAGRAMRRAGAAERACGGTLALRVDAPLDAVVTERLRTLARESRFRRLGGTQDLEATIRLAIVITEAADEHASVQGGSNGASLLEGSTLARALLGEDLAALAAPLRLPPLRTRAEDVPELVEHFVARANARFDRGAHGLSEPALAALASYDWPGNVRELALAIERAVLLATEPEIGDLAFVLDVPPARGSSRLGRRLCLPLDGSMSLAEMNRAIIAAALDDAERNTLAAARLLQATRQTLRYRIEKYGLQARTRQRHGVHRGSQR